MFKRCKVVMLPTKEKAEINLNEYRKDIPTLTHSKNIECYETNTYELIRDRGYAPQHLYIISDDDIKEGDWYINYIINPNDFNSTIADVVTKADLNNTNEFRIKPFSNYCKKIIATTDTSLTIKGESAGINNWYNPLPQPSNQFIQKYIEEYNKGNVITDVMIEYEGIEWLDNPLEYFPKINIKDNTITIKKVKDSWNREEVSSLIKQVVKGRECKSEFMCYAPIIIDIDKWIEQNL